MKAIICTEYGNPDVLRLHDMAMPVANNTEVLIRVCAVSVNYGDLVARNIKNTTGKSFHMPLLFLILARFSFGLKRPGNKILGNSFSGIIESVGKNVKYFRKGDSVFGYTGEKMGAYAQYLCMSENGILALKPLEMTFEEASTIPYGSLMALHLLRKVKIQKGQKVLIVGASGGIGSAAMQLAKYHFGANVTGVCGSKSAAFVKSLGAGKVIDYKKENYLNTGETYDLIFDILGKGSFSSYKTSLNPGGICLYASFKLRKLIRMLCASFGARKKVVCAFANPVKDDLVFVKQLVDEGKIKAVIDKCFPLEQTAAAHRYSESGMKAGNVVIKI